MTDLSIHTKPIHLRAASTDLHVALVQQCLDGDQLAQYRLYELYSKAMFNVCYRMMNSREEAEDMLQEAFTDAFGNLHRFRAESTFGAWLKRIVVNKCINELKRKKVPLDLREDVPENGKPEPDDTDEVANRKLEVQQVMKAVEQLPDGYRVIFSLYLLEGYDHREISQIMGISESTSKSQYLRAKRKVKELVAGS